MDSAAQPPFIGPFLRTFGSGPPSPVTGNTLRGKTVSFLFPEHVIAWGLAMYRSQSTTVPSITLHRRLILSPSFFFC
jgi:hypothetical protein